jgi:threonine dehydrogenase-like Zn-dependent dehydrogenase
VTERVDEGAAHIMNMTNGLGADSVLERVGTQESMQQAIRSARPGGYVGYVGVPRGHARRTGAVLRARPTARRPAPVRRFLPELIDLVWNGKINPGRCST